MTRQPNQESLGAALRVKTFGGFQVWRGDLEVPSTAWEREKALHVFQLLLTMRRRPLHKEQIIDLLWTELDLETGDRDFRVALNAIHKAIEPDKPPRAASRFIQRHGLAYVLNLAEVWIDVEDFEHSVERGNRLAPEDDPAAIEQYRAAVDLYRGDYLPERRYEDWTTSERERLRTLALSVMTRLAASALMDNPLESLHLTQRVIEIDPVWEEAYRIQMQAHLATGNRPLAIRAYEQCARVIGEEYGLEPLPATRALYHRIREIS